MSKKYDGWVLKSYCGRNPWLMPWTFKETRKEVLATLQRDVGESFRNYRRKHTHQIVKVKFVEINP